MQYKIASIILVLILFLCDLLLLLNTERANALTMTDGTYILHMGNLNTAGGTPTSSKYALDFTLGQTAPGLYIGTNYKIRAGFKYVHSIIAFSFSINPVLIDFGLITPTFPVTRTNVLTVTSGGANGYVVTAQEDHSLLLSGATTAIPDTICDSGPCSQTTAGPWISNLTYGLGYRCDNVAGTDCPSAFAANYYKAFANKALGQSAQTVMSNVNVVRNHKAQITYKVNVSGAQPAGTYNNVITYIATPTF